MKMDTMAGKEAVPEIPADASGIIGAHRKEILFCHDDIRLFF